MSGLGDPLHFSLLISHMRGKERKRAMTASLFPPFPLLKAHPFLG
jgi:hypothetical protein